MILIKNIQTIKYEDFIFYLHEQDARANTGPEALEGTYPTLLWHVLTDQAFATSKALHSILRAEQSQEIKVISFSR